MGTLDNTGTKFLKAHQFMRKMVQLEIGTYLTDPQLDK